MHSECKISTYMESDARANVALSVRNLVRSYGEGEGRHVAVDGVSFDVAAGQVVCLLGPNGAGKTTTVKMIATLLTPDFGDIRVCGVDAVAHPARARRELALLLGGERGFYMRSTALDNLRFFARIAGVPARQIDARIGEALEKVSLTEHAWERVETFSRGMTQRLHIARAMCLKARLVLLDEPTTGLDPVSALQVRELIDGMRREGAGIVLTTHAMAEAEALGDWIHLIRAGHIVASGTVRDLALAAGLDPDAATLEEAYLALMGAGGSGDGRDDGADGESGEGEAA